MPSRFALTTAVAAHVLLVAPSVAGACARGDQACEKREVRALFLVVLGQLHPGDGWPYTEPCVIDEAWPVFYRHNGSAVRPRAVLTPRAAMDPWNRHPERFCDLQARNDRVRAAARALDGDDKASINTADLSLTYPIFNANRTRAVLQRSGTSTRWRKVGPTGEFVASGGTVTLTKRHGIWIADYKTEWIAN